VIGGLGFFVWEEVVTVRRFQKFSVYTKLVLIASGVLILGGTVLFALLEWNNPGTLGNMPVGQKLLNSLFQSVTLRTAGFASVNQGALSEGGKAVSIVIMLIGGSSGSTAGGVKTVTFMVMLLFIWSRIRGRNTVTVFRRNIPTAKVTDAMTITTLVAGLSVLGAIFISAVDKVGFTDSLYETVSALATVGLTTGITSQVGMLSRLLLIVFMYFGRVGVLTISLGFLMGAKAEDRIRYADTNLLIG
jgi:trk system potassium uptake protein TrkH